MVKKIRCSVNSKDNVIADVSSEGDSVYVEMVVRGEQSNVILTPSNALKLRKQIKKALIAIEGDGESEA